MDNQDVRMDQLVRYQDLAPFTAMVRRWEVENPTYVPPQELVAEANPNDLFGIEIEIENTGLAGRMPPPNTVTQLKGDGSLRNEGLEYVSFPITLPYLPLWLSQWRAGLPETAKFTPRCGIHVHMNMRDMTKDQLWTFVLVYTVLEKLMFRFAGAGRKDNVFCVPIVDSDSLVQVLSTIEVAELDVPSVEKYVALNVLPMCRSENGSYGTVETRHLAGTFDLSKIIIWCRALAAIKRYIRFNPMDLVKTTIMDLNTDSGYFLFAEKVLNPVSNHFVSMTDDMQSLMESAVIEIKKVITPNDMHHRFVSHPINEKSPAAKTIGKLWGAEKPAAMKRKKAALGFDARAWDQFTTTRPTRNR